jgi:hypothetical protein
MKTLAFSAVAALLFAHDVASDARATAALAEAPGSLAAEVAAPADAEVVDLSPSLPAPDATPTFRETNALVPRDVKVTVRDAGKDGWKVELGRKGYFVALRRGAERTAAANTATLAVGAAESEPVVWETTNLATLATTRGTLRLSGGGVPQAKLRMAEAPVVAGREERRLHTCQGEEDGFGGFTVLCRVRAGATAANVTGSGVHQDVWASWGEESVLRLDLPASASGVEARVVGYSAGADGVVIRAEASRVAGEERPVLTILSADRAQPKVERKEIREYVCIF